MIYKLSQYGWLIDYGTLKEMELKKLYEYPFAIISEFKNVKLGTWYEEWVDLNEE